MTDQHTPPKAEAGDIPINVVATRFHDLAIRFPLFDLEGEGLVVKVSNSSAHLHVDIERDGKLARYRVDLVKLAEDVTAGALAND